MAATKMMQEGGNREDEIDSDASSGRMRHEMAAMGMIREGSGIPHQRTSPKMLIWLLSAVSSDHGHHIKEKLGSET